MRWVLLLIALALASGCKPVPSPSDEVVIAEYEAEQMSCVLEAGTKLDADRCRCAVHEKYGRPCVWVNLDGGAE